MTTSSAQAPPNRRPSHWLFRTQAWKLLASLRLLLVILGFAFIPLAVGTFFKQKALGGFNPDAEVERLGPQLYALLETFGVFNIYHSWYFLALLGLLSLNNVCCTIDRFYVKMKRLTSKAVGVIIVHVGVNVVLVGAAIGNRTGVEGFMQIFEGTQENTMFDLVSMQQTELPFTVQLDDFRLQMYEEPDQRILFFDAQTRETSDVLTLDATVSLPHTYAIGRHDLLSSLVRFLRGGPDRSVRVERYFPDAHRRMVFEPTEDGSGPWGADLLVTRDDRQVEGYLTSGAPSRMVVLSERLTAAYVRAHTPEQFANALASRAGGRVDAPTLIVRDVRTGLETPYPLVVGEAVELHDGAVTLTALRYEPNFTARQGTIAQATGSAPRNPAVQVRLRDGSVERTGWLFARFGAASNVASDRVAVVFRQGLQAGGTPHEVDFVVGPGGERRVVHRVHGEVQTTGEALAGSVLRIEALDLELQVRRYVDGGRPKAVVENQSDEPVHPALEVTIEQKGAEPVTQWLFAGEPGDLPGTGENLVYQRDFAIREFQSDLSIFKDGRKVIDRQEIIVNRYLDVGGYHIYQASYDAEGGRWSGLSIKRDPGIPVIYSGFTLMFLGMIFLFYVRPVLESRRRGTPLIPEAAAPPG